MKKKIYIVGLSRFTTPSGICRYAFNLTEILSGLDDVDVTLLVGDWQKDYFEKAFNWASVNAKLEVVSIINNSFWRNFWFVFILPLIIFKRKVNWLFLAFPIPFLSFLTPQTKIVTSIHDLYAFEFPQNFKFPFFNRLFTQISANSADIISALSFETAEKIKTFLPSFSSKVVVNYTPFPYKEFVSNHDKNNYDYFLTVAQHRKNKNIDILIRAFSEFKKLKPESSIKLVIIGSEGPETLNLKGLVNILAIKQEIIFKHGIPDDELIDYYINCQGFILISSTEGLGIPLIESLYYCKYVICSDIKVFKEIDEQNCNFVDLGRQPVEQVVNYFSGEMKVNKMYKQPDKRFVIDEIRKKYRLIVK